MTDCLTGSIQEKNGKYYAVLNFKDETGKRRQKWINTNMPVKNNKRNAEKFLKKTLDEYEQSAMIPSNDMLFCDFLQQWLEMNRSSWATRTYECYKMIVENQLVPYFRKMGVKLQNLQPYHLQSYYQKKLEQDKASGGTVMRHHANLHKALKYAVLINLIPYNPADRVILPKKQKYIGDFYNAEEIGELISAVKGTHLETVVMLTAYYGLRRSEVLGIRWSAIDFTNKTVAIENKVVQITTKTGQTKLEASRTLKTDSSLRTLPLIAKVADHLEELKKRQEADKALFGNTYCTEFDGYICRFEDGRLISPNYVTLQFRKFLERNQFRKIRFHDLRHSCATLLLALGFSMKEVQVWLGHNNFSTTANIYAHVEYKSKVALAQKLNDTINIG